MVVLRPGRADDVVALTQLDAPHAGGVAAHAAHVVLLEADGHAVVADDEDGLLSVGLPDGDQLVALFQGDAADAGLPGGVDDGSEIRFTVPLRVTITR